MSLTLTTCGTPPRSRTSRWSPTSSRRSRATWPASSTTSGRIASLDLADVPPTSHALDLVNVLGEDVPREPWPREQLLALAPERTADGFLVPPIGA